MEERTMKKKVGKKSTPGNEVTTQPTKLPEAPTTEVEPTEQLPDVTPVADETSTMLPATEPTTVEQELQPMSEPESVELPEPLSETAQEAVQSGSQADDTETITTSKTQLIHALSERKKGRPSRAEVEASRHAVKLKEIEDDAKELEAQLADLHVVVSHSFTISKSIDRRDAVRLRKDFDRYLVEDEWAYEKETIEGPIQDDESDSARVYAKGYRYEDNYSGITWSIMGYSRRDEEDDVLCEEYTLEVIIEPYSLMDSNLCKPPYNGSSIMQLEKRYDNYAKQISPLLENFNSFKLAHIDCKVWLSVSESKCSSELLADLCRRSNIPANYNEAEKFIIPSSLSIDSEDRDRMITGAAKVELVRHDDYGICYNIRRTSRYWGTMESYADEEYTYTDFTVEQMLSRDYAAKTAATYLKVAVMGGHYYSIERAVEIIKRSELTDERKNRLIRALDMVDHHKGIHNAKKIHQASKGALFEFINNLHMLVELGINPVTIPKHYYQSKYPNPIRKVEQNGILAEGKIQTPYRTEVQEYVGDERIQCRVY
jgi:hypothetical protein